MRMTTDVSESFDEVCCPDALKKIIFASRERCIVLFQTKALKSQGSSMILASSLRQPSHVPVCIPKGVFG